MKKALIVLMVSFFLSASWSLVFGAEMAKEGESNLKAAISATARSLQMERERAEIQIEGFGVVVEAKEDSPLYKATSYVLATSRVHKGAYEYNGFIRWTRPDGDQLFGIIEGKGTVGDEMRLKITIVGGTGKCLGITGAGESIALRGLRPPKEGVIMNIMIGKFSWKIP